MICLQVNYAGNGRRMSCWSVNNVKSIKEVLELLSVLVGGKLHVDSTAVEIHRLYFQSMLLADSSNIMRWDAKKTLSLSVADNDVRLCKGELSDSSVKRARAPLTHQFILQWTNQVYRALTLSLTSV